MIVSIISFALLGGGLTAAALWHEGAMAALAGAPLGGSLAVMAVAMVTAMRGANTFTRPARPAPVRAQLAPIWTAAAHA